MSIRPKFVEKEKNTTALKYYFMDLFLKLNCLAILFLQQISGESIDITERHAGIYSIQPEPETIHGINQKSARVVGATF